MRRRRQRFEWPAGLERFKAADWQEWMLDGPDPAADSFKDGDSTAFYAGIADRPDLVAFWRRMDAHRRWSAVRVQWLKDNGFEWVDVWVRDLQAEHRMREGHAATVRRPGVSSLTPDTFVGPGRGRRRAPPGG